MSNCNVIALTNQKGCVGKTTTAVNLDVSLANQDKKVLLINAHAQANLTMSLGDSQPDDLPVTLSTIIMFWWTVCPVWVCLPSTHWRRHTAWLSQHSPTTFQQKVWSCCFAPICRLIICYICNLLKLQI